MMLIKKKPGFLGREPENWEVIYFLKWKIAIPNDEKKLHLLNNIYHLGYWI